MLGFSFSWIHCLPVQTPHPRNSLYRYTQPGGLVLGKTNLPNVTEQAALLGLNALKQHQEEDSTGRMPVGFNRKGQICLV